MSTAELVERLRAEHPTWRVEFLEDREDGSVVVEIEDTSAHATVHILIDGTWESAFALRHGPSPYG